LRLRFPVSVETIPHQVLEWLPQWQVRAASQIFPAQEDGRAERLSATARPVHLRGYRRRQVEQWSVWQKAIVLQPPKYHRREAEQRLVWQKAVVLSMLLHSPKYHRREAEQPPVWLEAIALSVLLRLPRYRRQRVAVLFFWRALVALEERVVRAEPAAKHRGDNRKLHEANQASIPYARK
jgi:hypothetical protein